MQSEELQVLTASEPLTLEEEYGMQGTGYHSWVTVLNLSAGFAESWRKDEDSESYILCRQIHCLMDSLELTFIILACEDPLIHNPLTSEDIAGLRMIGDVNLFIKEGEEEEGQPRVGKEGEVEVMIAGMLLCVRLFAFSQSGTEPASRRKGLAHAALSAFLHYAIMHVLPCPMLVTRISATNTPSIRLFEKLGFERIKEPNFFGEIEMRFKGDQTVWGDAGVQVHHPESQRDV